MSEAKAIHAERSAGTGKVPAEAKAIQAERSAETGKVSAKPRILIVDDEAGFTRLVKLNLEGTGRYDVRDAPDGATALEAARVFHPDVVVLDVMMPGLDGGQVAAKLRAANAGRAPLPIIFVSATSQSHAGANLGQQDTGCPFLSKPISLDTLVACIEQQLSPAEPPSAAAPARRTGKEQRRQAR